MVSDQKADRPDTKLDTFGGFGRLSTDASIAQEQLAKERRGSESAADLI